MSKQYEGIYSVVVPRDGGEVYVPSLYKGMDGNYAEMWVEGFEVAQCVSPGDLQGRYWLRVGDVLVHDGASIPYRVKAFEWFAFTKKIGVVLDPLFAGALPLAEELGIVKERYRFQ